MCLPCICLLFFIPFLHALTTRQTCLLLTSCTSCSTCVCLKANTFFYLFKPVVRQLISTENLTVLTSELLDLRQYLAIGNLSIFNQNIGLKLELWTTWLSNFNRQTCSLPNTSTGSLSVTNSFSSSTHVCHIFYFSFHLWSTCILLKADMPFTYVCYTFTLCFTCVCLKANTCLLLI